ncbi:hypothetical protein GCM10023220_09430 [Streptomyces ziwulingensis]|uniref:Uncharacterized protein n=1 Tax=Streptomyces ziwulingensis TaxID=1045501 RepID=A0ABP9AWL2_9ACTN
MGVVGADERVGTGFGSANAMPGVASTVTAQTTVTAAVIRPRFPGPTTPAPQLVNRR